MMRWTLAVVALLGVGGAAQGQTLEAGSTTVGMLSNGWEMSGQEQAQAFMSHESFVATQASIWTTFQGGDDLGPYDNGFRGQFAWALYSDASGAPGAAVASGAVTPTRVDYRPVSPGVDRSEWSFALPDVALQGNTQYWLGLLNTDNTGSETNAHFFWAGSYGPYDSPGSQQRGADGVWHVNPPTDADYYGDGNHLSMAIYGDPITSTPEPSELLLVASALSPVLALMRRRQRLR